MLGSFLMTIVILGAARFLITSLESDSSELYGALNQIAVSVISAEHSSASEVQNAFLHYEDIIGSHHSESFNPLGLILKDVSLVKPEFSNSDEKKAYQEEFRHSVQSIRQRNYEVLQALFSLTYVLVGIMILVFLFGFLMFRFLNRDLISFIRILSENLSSLTERMNYGKVSALEIGDSAPLELRELGLKIRTIEEGIVLDQFLDNIDSLGSLKEVLEKLAHTVENLIPFDRIALAFNDLEGKITAETAFTRYEKIYLEPGYSEELNNTSLKGIIQIREGRIINDLPLYAETHSISKSTKLILHEGIKASLTIPMFLEGRCRGFLFFSSREKSCYTQSHLKTARRLANRLKNTFFHEYISQELIAETAQSFVELMNAKDNETSAHLTRMSHYSYIIARSLSRDDFSVSPGFPREILWFAP
ncbi:MAG: GAF domain-containing protein, partial [Spirochaetales bacterium]|nr:GAF domain-containing protein [Spirochaetales bacterium]